MSRGKDTYIVDAGRQVKQRPHPAVRDALDSDKYHLILPKRNHLLAVIRQPGKAAIWAASSSLGSSTQRPQPERDS